MRVLFIAPQFPWPATCGQQQRTLGLLRAIAERHQVILTAPAVDDLAERLKGIRHLVRQFVPVPQSAKEYRTVDVAQSRLKRWWQYCGDLRSTIVPLSCRLARDTWARAIADLSGVDVAVCRYSSLMGVLAGMPANRVVLDADDLRYVVLRRTAIHGTTGWERGLAAFEAVRAFLYEQSLFRRVAQTLVCSQADLARVRAPNKTIIRNGIDLPDAKWVQRLPEKNTLVFVGSLLYDPNADGLRWFVRRVWPLLRSRIPDIRLYVVGHGATAAGLPFAVVPGIELIGKVDHPAEWISSALVSIVPLWCGGGTRIKIAESLGYGRCVVATRVGAEGYEGVTAEHGLFRCNAPQEMADVISDLVTHSDRTLAAGRVGRQLVEQRFTWDRVTATLGDDLVRWVRQGALSP